MKSIKIQDKAYLIIGTTICVLFMLSKLMSTAIFAYIGVVLVILDVIFDKSYNNIFLFLFLCANTTYLVLGERAICGYIGFLLLIKFILNGQIKIKIELSLLGIILFLLYILFNALINKDGSLIKGYIKVIVYVLLFLGYYSQHRFQLYNLVRKSVQNNIWGGLIGSLLGILYTLLKKGNIFSSSIYLRYIGLSNDPNYFSAIMVFATALLVLLFFDDRKLKIWGILSLFLFVVLGLASLSRGYLLSLFLLVIVVALKLFFDFKIKFRYKLIVGAIVVAILIILYYQTSVFQLIEKRFTGDQDLSNGRLEIWSLYLKEWSADWIKILFGSGNTRNSITFSTNHHIPHNTLIDLLYELGIVGLLLYVCLFIILYKKVTNRRYNKVGLSFLPSLIVFSTYSFLSQTTEEGFIIAMIISILVLKVRFGNNAVTIKPSVEV